MSGLFSTFNIAKRGINVQQRTIDVTSHNISNVKTPGYSRQRAKIETTRAHGGLSTSGVGKGQVGTGAQIQAIERVRDSFLDYQVRGETSIIGKYDVRNKYLFEVETIFNEPSENGISTLIGKFFDSFQELSKQPQNSNSRTVVAQQTLALTDALNHTYTKLEELQKNAQMMLKSNVTEINSYLDQINRLNQEIVSITTAGHAPNDLLDKRDLLLDQLSYKFNIQVDKGEFNGVDLKPENPGGMKAPNLISSNPSTDTARFSMITDIKKDPNDPNIHLITYYKRGNMDGSENMQTIKVVGMTDEEAKNLKASGVIWANNDGQATKGDGYPIKNGEVISASELMIFSPLDGELSGNISIQGDIQKYMDELNSLAKAIAFSVNAIHSGQTSAISNSGHPDMDYMPLFVNNDVAKYNSANEMANLREILESEKEITAKNITINKEILKDVMKIKTKTNDNLYAYTGQNNVDGDTDGRRALSIAQLRNSIMRIQDFGTKIQSREDMFISSKGGSRLVNNGMDLLNADNGMTMDSYFKDTIDRLGIQAQEAKRMVENQEELLANLELSRASISGVSLDEEMANLIQFQHAYNANAKVISTVDELLEVVVNGLKR